MTGISGIGGLGFSGLGGLKEPLTPATKAKLQQLGIDTTNIKTEAEGQQALKASLTTQVGAANPRAKISSEASIISQIKELADKLGVKFSSNEKPEEILSKIKSKIEELKTETGKNSSKASEITDDESKCQSLYKELSVVETSKATLSASMNNLALLNKISLKLG